MKTCYTKGLLLVLFAIGTLWATSNNAAARGSLLTYSKTFVDLNLLKSRVDSICYTYGGGRAGDQKTTGGAPFDSSKGYWYAQGAGTPNRGALTVRHYNTSGLVDTQTTIGSQRNIYSYNTSGMLLQTDIQSANGNLWVPASRELRNYNKGGFDSVVLYIVWNSSSLAWENNRRTTRSYDVAGNNITILGEQWNTNTWVPLYRITNSFNTANQLVFENFSSWNTGTSSWEVNLIYTFSYTGTFRSAQVVTTLSGGVFANADSTTYSSAGTPTTLTNITYHKSNATAAFLPNGKNTFILNPGGNITSHILENWFGGGWTNVQLVSSGYNSDDQQLSEYLDRWDGTKWAFDYHYSYEIHYTYGAPTVAVGSVAGNAGHDLKLTLSPVPANTRLSMEIAFSHPQGFVASITDINGKLLRKRTNIATNSKHVEMLSISDLAPGVYHLSIETQEGFVTRAFVVQ